MIVRIFTAVVLMTAAALPNAFASAPPKTSDSLKPASWTQLGEWTDADGASISGLGHKVLNADKKTWVHGESANFVYHTQSPGDMAGLADEVEYAYRKSASYLGPAPAKKKGHVFLVSPKTWMSVITKNDRRRDSLAMQLNSDIFVLKSDNETANIVRIPHEIVHYRLWQQYERDVPVWLDEGLAGCLGWKMAESYRMKNGKRLTRKLPPVEAGDILMLEELTAINSYPGGPGKASAFYRQSEEVVSGIARKIGYDRLAELVTAVVAEGQDWRAYLSDRFSYSDADFKWLENEVKKQVLGGVK